MNYGDTYGVAAAVSGWMTNIASTVSRLEATHADMCRKHNAVLDDLSDLIAFLVTNPECDIRDWARYEAVKARLAQANADRKAA